MATTKVYKVQVEGTDTFQSLQSSINTSVQSGKDLKRELKDLKAAMLGLEGDEFQAAAKRAAQLSDEIGDINQQVKILSDDSFKLKGFISVAEGIMTGFVGAQSAMELFGIENADVLKSMQRMQAAMGVLNALQSVQALLQKESTLMLFLNNTVMKSSIVTRGIANAQIAIENGLLSSNIVIKYAATAAQWALNAAMSANPIGLVLVAVGSLVALWAAFGDKLGQITGLWGNSTLKIEASNAELKAQSELLKDLKEDWLNYDAQYKKANAQVQADIDNKNKLLKLQIDGLKLELDKTTEYSKQAKIIAEIAKLEKQMLDDAEKTKRAQMTGVRGIPIGGYSQGGARNRGYLTEFQENIMSTVDPFDDTTAPIWVSDLKDWLLNDMPMLGGSPQGAERTKKLIKEFDEALAEKDISKIQQLRLELEQYVKSIDLYYKKSSAAEKERAKLAVIPAQTSIAILQELETALDAELQNTIKREQIKRDEYKKTLEAYSQMSAKNLEMVENAKLMEDPLDDVRLGQFWYGSDQATQQQADYLQWLQDVFKEHDKLNVQDDKIKEEIKKNAAAQQAANEEQDKAANMRRFGEEDEVAFKIKEDRLLREITIKETMDNFDRRISIEEAYGKNSAKIKADKLRYEQVILEQELDLIEKRSVTENFTIEEQKKRAELYVQLQQNALNRQLTDIEIYNEKVNLAFEITSAIIQYANQVGQLVIENQQRIIEKQIEDIREKIEEIDALIAANEDRQAESLRRQNDLEAGLDEARGLRRVKLLEGIAAEAAAREKLAKEAMKLEEEKLKKEEEAAKKRREIEKLAAQSNLLQSSATAALAIAEIAAQSAKQDFTFGIATVGSILAVTAAMTNAIAAAKQLSEFEDGGINKYQDGGVIDGPSHANGGVKAINPNGRMIEMEGNELIVNKGIWSRPDFVKSISKMNAATGGKDFYAAGGINNVNQMLSGNNLQSLLMANLQKPIYTSVVDITKAQTRVNKIKEMTTLK